MLPVRDVPASVAFYVDTLGFEDVWHDDRYAVVRRDNVVLHLQWHDASEWSVAIDRPMLRIVVPDVDALYAEYAPRGVFHDGTAMRDTPWGTREFAFYDPDRNGLTFMRDLVG